MGYSMVKNIFQYIGGLSAFAFGCLMLCMPIFLAEAAQLSDKNHGKATIKVIRKENGRVEVVGFFQPTFTFRIESGNPEGVLQCEQWTIVKKSGNYEYPVFQLKCGAVALTLTDVSMLDPIYEIR